MPVKKSPASEQKCTKGIYSRCESNKNQEWMNGKNMQTNTVQRRFVLSAQVLTFENIGVSSASFSFINCVVPFPAISVPGKFMSKKMQIVPNKDTCMRKQKKLMHIRCIICLSHNVLQPKGGG